MLPEKFTPKEEGQVSLYEGNELEEYLIENYGVYFTVGDLIVSHGLEVYAIRHIQFTTCQTFKWEQYYKPGEFRRSRRKIYSFKEDLELWLEKVWQVPKKHGGREGDYHEYRIKKTSSGLDNVFYMYMSEIMERQRHSIFYYKPVFYRKSLISFQRLVIESKQYFNLDLNVISNQEAGLFKDRSNQSQHQSESTAIATLNPQAAKHTRKDALTFIQQSEARNAIMSAMGGKLKEDVETKLRELQARVDYAMEPVKRMVRRLDMVIKQITVYLGMDNAIKQIQVGENPFEPGPIAVYQNPFYMDEEIGDPTNGGLRVKHIADFDQWLCMTDKYYGIENYKRILPQDRAIAIFRVRRNHHNTWFDSKGFDPDFHTYILIRNGENLYRICTHLDMKKLNLGDTLFPDPAELQATKEGIMNSLKKEYEKQAGEIVLYKSYTKRELDEQAEEFEKLELKFRLNLLFLQGLIDRREVFPLMEGKVDFFAADVLNNPYLDLLFNNGRDRLIEDGTLTFEAWRRSVNKNVEVGSRIYFVKPVDDYSEYSRDVDAKRLFLYEGDINTMSGSSRPSSGLYRVERMREANYPKDHRRIKYQEQQAQYKKEALEDMFSDLLGRRRKDRQGSREPDYFERKLGYRMNTLRYSCAYDGPYIWFQPGGTVSSWTYYGKRKNRVKYALDLDDDFYLHFDGIEREHLEQLNHIMHDRRNRADYLHMIPMLREVIEMREAELKIEEGFADALMSHFRREYEIHDEDTFYWLVLEGIKWYKLKNKYKRPLPFGDWEKLYPESKQLNFASQQEEEAKATRMIAKFVQSMLN